MTPAVIFGRINMATSIAAYFGLIESVGGNVQKLLHQAFKSAIQNLEYAQTASSDINRLDYIKTAKERFIDAISVEENENLISSYVGLAMCQHLMGDIENRDITIQSINDVKLTLSEKTKAVSKTAFKIIGIGNIYSLYKIVKGENPYTTDYANRLAKFENYKQLALATK